MLSAEVFASGAVTRASGDTLSAFELPRAETGAALDFTPHLSAALRLEAVRSATAGGTTGLDGDSLIIRLKRAAVGGHVTAGPVTLHGDAGLVADPWIEQLERGYPLRALAPTASEALLAWDASDVGARLAIDAIADRVHVAILVANGEGRRFPERNDGKTTTGVVDIRAIDTTVAALPLALHLRAVGRDGSIGPASTRDARYGGGLLVTAGPAAAGAEVVRALGLAGRGELQATALAVWAAVPLWRRLGVAGRWGALRLDGGLTSHRVIGAVAYDLIPASADGTAVRAFLATEWDRDRTTAPGADADAVQFLLVLAATGSVAVESR